MNQKEWDEMSNGDRLEYLESNPVGYTKQACLDGSKKVGDMSAVSLKYLAAVGEVYLGAYDSAQDCLEAHEEAISYYRQLLDSE